MKRPPGNRFFLLAFAFLSLLSCSDGGTAPPDPTLEQRLDAALTAGFEETEGRGIQVSVLIPGRPMWTGVRGTSHGSVPITPRSVFGAGSTTKMFTALAILRLAEEGLLTLDDRVGDWFPPYPHVDPDITLRQLLNHTSGLSDFVDPPGWLTPLLNDPTREWGMEEFFLATIRDPYFPRGTHWSYSTSGYLLLRMLIEEITGSTVAEQYRRYIFEPLGLNDTYLCPGHALPDDFAHGWFDLSGDGIYDDLTSVSNISWCTMAGGAVYSTSADLARLANAVMHERTILEDASYDQMKDFYFPVGHDEPMVHGYGLGLLWFNRDFLFGQEVWGHSGNAIGYAAGSLYLIDYGVSVGIMDNTEHGLAMQVLDRIFDVIVEFMENG